MGVILRQRKLANGGKRYFLDIYHNRERSYEFLDIVIGSKDPKRQEKERLAQTIRATREIEIISKGTTYVPSHRKELNFFVFADMFVTKYRNKDIKIIKGCIQKFSECVGKKPLKISQITPSLMEDFKDYLIHDADLSGETPHNYFSRFKKILRAIKRDGHIKEMPTADIKFKNPNKNDTLKKEVLDINELRILSNTHCGNNEVKKAFYLACYSSLGLAEIRDLKWRDIRNGRLVVSRNKTGEQISNPLNENILKMLGEPQERNDYVFDLQNISDTAVNKNLKNWIKRAEIEKHITFYCARHTFACLLLENGANLKTVADFMGHSSTKSTLKYLNHVQHLQNKAIENLPSIQLGFTQ